MKTVTNEQILELLTSMNERLERIEEAQETILAFIDDYYQDLEEGAELFSSMMEEDDKSSKH